MDPLTILLIAAAGVADGFNPCSFAGLLVFASVTPATLCHEVSPQGPEFSRRKLIRYGSTWIVALFVTYSAIGLGFLGSIRLLVAGGDWAGEAAGGRRGAVDGPGLPLPEGRYEDGAAGPPQAARGQVPPRPDRSGHLRRRIPRRALHDPVFRRPLPQRPPHDLLAGVLRRDRPALDVQPDVRSAADRRPGRLHEPPDVPRGRAVACALARAREDRPRWRHDRARVRDPRPHRMRRTAMIEGATNRDGYLAALRYPALTPCLDLVIRMLFHQQRAKSRVV